MTAATESAAPANPALAIRRKLSVFFSPKYVEWKPQSVSGNRALAIAYIDARAVMKRLDDVLGVDGWEDRYEVLPDGCVVCTLRCKIAGEWITKMDVGGESDQKDEADRRKASFSDALKRAAVKFGIGRYLYSLPSQWVEWDAQRRCFAQRPELPAWAIPKREQADAPATASPPATQPVPAQATISQAQEVQLRELLERKGISWKRVVEVENLPPNWTPRNLTVEMWGAIVDKLTQQHTDRTAQPARK